MLTIRLRLPRHCSDGGIARRADRGERVVDLLGLKPVGLANEAQRHTHVLCLHPARALQVEGVTRQGLADILGRSRAIEVACVYPPLCTHRGRRRAMRQKGGLIKPYAERHLGMLHVGFRRQPIIPFAAPAPENVRTIGEPDWFKCLTAEGPR